MKVDPIKGLVWMELNGLKIQNQGWKTTNLGGVPLVLKLEIRPWPYGLNASKQFHSTRLSSAQSQNISQMSTISLPEHKISESPNSRSIEVGGWSITTSTNPISNAFETDTLHASLGIPLPEMTFGNNFLALKHHASGWEYTFSTEDALKAVKKGELEEGDGGVKVGYADAWLKSRYGRQLPGRHRLLN